MQRDMGNHHIEAAGVKISCFRILLTEVYWHTQRFCASSARSRKNKAPAQLATRDASGSAKNPKAKKAGNMPTNMTLLSADSLS